MINKSKLFLKWIIVLLIGWVDTLPCAQRVNSISYVLHLKQIKKKTASY